ncbi:ATP-grasp domain-containing protein [Shewanella sp. Isolate13]|uniref:ATP-grasp domain-containing protein n=1 Tax=Shewanella sp. Isolate13 TaxID=2908531 RepID=UPI001EFDC94F|nr:ATP-grasp domain-containing protein [Shewanella sp. Isolate13]MCG9729232.1 ATP-grasp domain-containing protein [Shewanella sp. Isolate13]
MSLAKCHKTVLLLGGSRDQLFLIKTANNMGLHTVVVDANPESPGFAIADDYAVVSTMDLGALKAFVDDYQEQQRKIDAVCVMGSDISQYVAQLAEHIQVPHIPIEAAMITTNKLKMKQCFERQGVAIPWFCLLDSAEHLAQIAAKRGLPLIIKPLDRSGARGVFLLTQDSDLSALYDKAKSESFAGDVMVEEYLAGPQISTETIMYRGQAYTPGYVDRNYEMLSRFAPNIIENGGWQPSLIQGEERAKVEALIEQAALALGLTDGVIKGDIVYTDVGPKIIEVATRLSGGDFSESLVPLGLGINYVEAALKIALGEPPELEKLTPVIDQAVANRYFFPKPGKVTSISGIEAIQAEDFVKKLEIWYQVGDVVPETTSHASRFGVFIVTADNRQQLEQRVKWVYDTLKVTTL